MLIATKYRSIPELINYQYKYLLSFEHHITCTYAMECFSSIGNWDPQPPRNMPALWKAPRLRNHGNWNSVQFWWLLSLWRWVGILFSRSLVKGNLQWASWIVTLAPPSLWAQTNGFISCACFFFFLISQFLFSFFCIQRYMSSEALRTLHSKSGTNPGGRMRQRDNYLVSSTKFLHKFCARLDEPMVMYDVSCAAPCLTHLYIFSWPLGNWSLCGTFHEWSSALHSTKITGTYL